MGYLVLFGGGLSLAAAFESIGLTGWLGGKLVVLAGLPSLVVIAAVTVLFVFVTEINGVHVARSDPAQRDRLRHRLYSAG